jgi:serine/threonine protein kinase
MAELYLALHRSMAGFEKLVVIKCVLPLLNCEEDFIAMLLHEARIAATLSHPNIVQIYDVGQIDGTYFIAMEHIQGEDLRAIQRQLQRRGDGLPMEHALSVAIGLCSGLAYAHEKRDIAGDPLGIVHRDISPHNVIVTFSGDVKLIDFGVAKSRVQLGDQTRSGAIKGKIAYMSPEQALGHPIDSRSDVFAIGTTLYELTTGRRLFKGKTDFETLRLVGTASVELPSAVVHGYPRELEKIVMQALTQRPEDRYQSARALQSDLEAFVHAARLQTSPIALADFMHDLFGDKLRDQDQLLAKAKVLADSALIDGPEGFQSEHPQGHSRSAPPDPTSVSDVQARESRDWGWGWYLFAAAMAAFFLMLGSKREWQKVDAHKGRWFVADEVSGAIRADNTAPNGSSRRIPSVMPLGKLSINASGGGCQISVDGQPTGQPPILELVLSSGVHAVSCSPSQGKVLSLDVRVDPGETAHVGFVVP